MKDKIIAYLKNDNHYWWTVGLLPGLYAISYLYLNNYTLVNSWTQLLYLGLYMILLPSIFVAGINYLLKNKSSRLKNTFNSSALIILTAIMLSLVIYLWWRWKGIILVIIIAIVASWFLGKHYKKGVLLLAFMTLLSLAQLSYYLMTEVVTYESWILKNEFTDLKFKKKPNIYYIQPDGYASKPALENENYRYDNTDFYQELIPRGFVLNHNFRSNYSSTLTSNAATFTGQHHFYDNGNLKNELFNARQIIMGDNPVLQTFQKNGYQTTAILQHRYLLINHPKVGFDRINIKDEELAILPDYKLDKDYFNDLKSAIQTASVDPQFYFIEILEPSHIPGLLNEGSSIEKERDAYINRLQDISLKLFYMVDYIKKYDPEALVIIAADHGGFVGYNYATESYEKPTNDVTLQQGIFSSLFAIKAPNDFKKYEKEIKSSISIFPTIFSYLADEPSGNQQIDNSSYHLIKNGTQRGIYRYYDEEGNSDLQKL